MAFAINRLANRSKDFLLAMQEDVIEAGPELQWNGLTVTEAYAMLCMSGKSKRPSALVGPYVSFEQPILVYAASLLDLVANRRIQFRRSGGRTCIHVVNKQPCSTFLDTPVFEHITTREAVMNGAPVALKDCLFYCTFADNDIDPHVYAVMKSLEDKGYVGQCRRSSFLQSFITYELRNSQTQDELLAALRAELHKCAAPEELTLFTRLLLGLVYLEYQSLKRGGMQYVGITQNPFVRYTIVRAEEFSVHRPLLKANVYSAREKYAQLHDGKINDEDSAIPDWPMTGGMDARESATLPSTGKPRSRGAWSRPWWRQESTNSEQQEATCNSDGLEPVPSECEHLLGGKDADGGD